MLPAIPDFILILRNIPFPIRWGVLWPSWSGNRSWLLHSLHPGGVPYHILWCSLRRPDR